jgi:tetratricopeptide (TPR) repeat protein
VRRGWTALLALAAACAGQSPDWDRYEGAGEAAARHARYDKAEWLLERALAETRGPGSERAQTLVALARVERERGQLEAARARLDEARAAAARLPPGSPETVALALEEGWLLLAEQRLPDAAATFEEAGDAARRVLGEDDRAVGWAEIGRGEALQQGGDLEGARALLADAVERLRGEATAETVRPSDPTGVIVALTALAAISRERGELDDARSGLEVASSLAATNFGTGHPLLADVLSELARVELARGDREAALRAAKRAVEIARHLPERHATRISAEAALALCRTDD